MIFGWFKVGFVKMRMCRRILLAILWVGFVIAGLHYFTGIQSNQDSQRVVVFGESLNLEHFSYSLGIWLIINQARTAFYSIYRSEI